MWYVGVIGIHIPIKKEKNQYFDLNSTMNSATIYKNIKDSNLYTVMGRISLQRNFWN